MGRSPCGMRDALTEAVTELRYGGSTEAVIRQLENDETDELAAALARLGRAHAGEETLAFTGMPDWQRTLPHL